MPCICDNWDFDGCEDGHTPSHCTSPGSPEQRKHHQRRSRIGAKRHFTHIEKDSSALSKSTLPSDKDSPPAACLLLHTLTPEFESPSNEKLDASSYSPKSRPILGSSGSSSQNSFNAAFNPFFTKSVEADDGRDAPIALTTTITNDQGRSISSGANSNNDNNNDDNNNTQYRTQEQQTISKKELMHSQMEKSPVSNRDTSFDGFSSSPNLQPIHQKTDNVKRAFFESKRGPGVIPVDMKRHFLFQSHNSNGKVSSQTASTSSSSPRLYDLLHSRECYNSLESPAFFQSSPFNLSSSSSSLSALSSHTHTSSYTNEYKSSRVFAKSSPDVRSYFSHGRGSPHFIMDSDPTASLSNNNSTTDTASSLTRHNQGTITDSNRDSIPIKLENLCSKSPPLSDHHVPAGKPDHPSFSTLTSNRERLMSAFELDKNSTMATASSMRLKRIAPMAGLKIEQEGELSLGLLHQHKTLSSSSSIPSASSPYSLPLSPWSDTGGEGSPLSSNNTLVIPIQNKTNCVSDSSLYVPRLIQPSSSPDPTSVSSTSQESMLVECRWKSCSQTFTSQKSLAQHVNDYHVRIERPDVDFQCHWQGCPRQRKGFNARYKMLIHIRTHTNEKPHKCAVCRKCFSRLENLKIHMRSHTGEKPYACTFPGCTKAYSNSSDRFKHVRTHQEEKPYKCKMPGCHKQYTDPSSLRKHVRTHNHGTKYGHSPPQHSGMEDEETGGQQMGSEEKDCSKHSLLSPLTPAHSQHSSVLQDDCNNKLEIDAERQRRHGLEGRTSQSDMSDIQRNIELYSNLEMKNGIQKFSQHDDSGRTIPYTCSSPQGEVKSCLTSTYCSSPSIFDQCQVPPRSKPLSFSVPSIIIEEAHDYSKSAMAAKRDVQSEDNVGSYTRTTDESRSEMGLHPKGMKRRSIEESDKEEDGYLVVDDKKGIGKDLRLTTGDFNDNLDRSQSSIPSNISSIRPANEKMAPSVSSSLSLSSPPKHWKKRKILDEQKQQEEEDEKKAKEQQEQQQNKELVKQEVEMSSSIRCSTSDTLNDNIIFYSRSSPSHQTTNELSSHLPQRYSLSPSSRHTTAHTTYPLFPVSTNQLIESLAMPTPSLMSGIHISPPISPESSQYPPPHHHISPHHSSAYNQSSNHCQHFSPSLPFLTPSLLYNYPELHSSTSKFDNSVFPLSPLTSTTTAAAAAAMLLPDTHKSCRDIYFPQLSALIDLSVMSSHRNCLSHYSHGHCLHPNPTLSPPHRHTHQNLDPVSNLMCPIGLSLSPISRALL